MTHPLWTRRKFLSRATSAATALAIPAFASSPFPLNTDPLRGRFLTHISVVRVNQIEVSPT
ncbi:MAG: twin-arginine translocation signal domain-containing protein, partial [Acidobacteriaceae bacterium]